MNNKPQNKTKYYGTGMASTAFEVGEIVSPDESLYEYICTTAGTSHATTQPTWPATSTAGATPATITDGTVTWTELLIPSITTNNGIYIESQTAGVTNNGIYFAGNGTGNGISWATGAKLSSGSTGDVTVTCPTDKTLILSETVYEDVQFPVSSGKVPSANYPSYETFTTNTNSYAFGVDDYIDCQSNEVFHSWKEGTAGSVHLHLAIKTLQNAGANRFAKFTVYVAYADNNEVWAEATALSAEYTIPNNTAALKHYILDIGSLALTNNLIGTQINIRIKRIAATGGTEYTGDVFITQAGIHFEIDTLGSRTLTAK
jgi:hypothetical protein